MQWPVFLWYPVQGQWGAGSGQGWAQHGPYAGESSHVFGPQPRGDPSPNKNEGDLSQESDRRDPNQGNGATQGQGFGSIPGQGPNPYPFFGSGYAPYLFPFGSNSRLEVGDPLFTSPADGPDLKLIQLQLTGLDNYSTWARDFHRVLITKDKEGFSRRIRALPNR